MKKISFKKIRFPKQAGSYGHSGGRRKSVQKKLFLRIVAISMMICILFGGTTIYLLYNSAMASMKSNVTSLAKAYGTAVQNTIGKYELAVQSLSKDDSLSDPKMTQWERTINYEKLASTYGLYKVATADANGKMPDGVDISKTECFKEASTGSIYISGDYTSELNAPGDKTQLMVIATELQNSYTKSGIVICYLSMGSLNGIINDMTIGKNGFGFVVGKSGTVIADKDMSNVINSVNYQDLAQKNSSYGDMAQLTQKMIKGGTAGMKVNYRGQNYYAAYAPIPGSNGWSIAAVAQEREMMSSLYTAIYVALGLMLLFILLSILVARRIAVPIVSPILKLGGRVKKLALGDLHTEVPEIRTGDEIEDLSNQFGVTVNSLNGYIQEISDVLNNMAQGDFTVQIRQDYRGDFVAIKEALNTILRSLNVMFQDLDQMAEQVAVGSKQVATGSQSLAQGASEQAGTIEELSSSLNEIAKQADHSAESAQNAEGISETTLQEVEEGGREMDQMVSAMSKIGDSSQKIGKIIKTIESIAFQTNILALNAAVEAARAGEAGKGFSVVADEVRNLAGRSAEAVKNTSSLIQETVNAVQEGQKKADRTAESLRSIIEKVEKMADLIRKISAASGEQSHAVNEVNRGVEQISAVVQTNSATAEESAAASGELDKLAQSLKDMLSGFIIEQEDKTENP